MKAKTRDYLVKNNSKTDVPSHHKYQQEIKQLKKETKLLKQAKNNHQEKTAEIQTSHTRPKSKNKFKTSVSHGNQNEKIDFINVINFIK